MAGEHVWWGGGSMHGRGHAWEGACMVGGMCGGGMHGMGACVTKGPMGQGVCMAGGHVWQGACIVRGCAWQGEGEECMAGETATAG